MTETKKQRLYLLLLSAACMSSLLMAGACSRNAATASGDETDSFASSQKKRSLKGHRDNRKPNRLIKEASPYLRQHAYNPVDWYPWGSEAWEKAKREDRPVLLSVGYSACHWCHVMEKESFEDEDVARLMNDNFVCIKLDREERPDLDEIYMQSVYLFTNNGGWPMTVFLTPDKEPFFAGTYFPKERKGRMPGFKEILSSFSKAWKQDRASLTRTAGKVSAMIKESSIPEPTTRTGDGKKVIERAITTILRKFDRVDGGLGSAPKFPHCTTMSLCLRELKSGTHTSEERKKELKHLFSLTLDRMAMGGMHDHVGGGFHRYSTDKVWLIPHFEKMLYDNASMASLYLRASAFTGKPFWRRTGRDCLDFILSRLEREDGGFYASLDADSEEGEGTFYVWTPAQLVEALGKNDARFVARVFGVTKEGNFEEKSSILHLSEPPSSLAKRLSLSEDQLWKRVSMLMERLRQVRKKRPRPARDEKIITAWNGLAISAMVDGYKVLGEERYLDAARKSARAILDQRKRSGLLLRTSINNTREIPAYLDDYSLIIAALIDLSQVDFDPVWLNEAVVLTDEMISRFKAIEGGEFYYTDAEQKKVLLRPRRDLDAARPSGSAAALFDLLRLERLTGDKRYATVGRGLMKSLMVLAQKAPLSSATVLAAMDFASSPSKEIVLVSAPGKTDQTRLLQRQIYSRYLPNTTLALLADRTDKTSLSTLLTRGRTAKNGNPTVYICTDFVCKEPISDAETLREELGKD